jgi:hypothetical protein
MKKYEIVKNPENYLIMINDINYSQENRKFYLL